MPKKTNIDKKVKSKKSASRKPKMAYKIEIDKKLKEYFKDFSPRRVD